MRYCTVKDCNNKLLSRGWCNKHYKRMKRNGALELARTKILARFDENTIMDFLGDRVRVTDGCWIWLSQQYPSGYALLQKNSKNYRLHRLMYKIFITEPSSDLVLDHLCEVKLCINPYHLEEVTIGENLRRYWDNKKQNKENI